MSPFVAVTTDVPFLFLVMATQTSLEALVNILNSSLWDDIAWSPLLLVVRPMDHVIEGTCHVIVM